MPILTPADIPAIWLPEGRSQTWSLLHPKVQEFVIDFAEESTQRKWPLPMFTDSTRTPARQRIIYPDRHPLPFSWHLTVPCCGLDARTRHYAPTERQDLVAWVDARCPKPTWEVLVHDVGLGKHLHVAYRDLALKAAWLAARDRGEFDG